MIEMMFGLLIVTNISVVSAYLSEYILSLVYIKNKLEAEIVGFEQKRVNGGRGLRSDFHSLVFFRNLGVPHTYIIGRDRKDYLGKRIIICYSEKHDIILRKAVRKTFYLNSKLVQGLYYFVLVFFVGLDLGIQVICFRYIDSKTYVIWMWVALIAAFLSLLLSCMYKIWDYQRLND